MQQNLGQTMDVHVGHVLHPGPSHKEASKQHHNIHLFTGQPGTLSSEHWSE